MRTERRNLSFAGRRRRGEFERSKKTLQDFGMIGWVLEYYMRAARATGQLPHQIVVKVAGWYASKLGKSLGQMEEIRDPSGPQQPIRPPDQK